MKENFVRMVKNGIAKGYQAGKENGGKGGFTTLLEFRILTPFTNTRGKEGKRLGI